MQTEPTSASANLTPSEALALISAVQLATTITDLDLIQKDAVMAAKKIQESLGKDSEIFKFLELGWKIKEGGK